MKNCYILIHANVLNGSVWEITYLACGKDSYDIEYGFSTYGGWESGPWMRSNHWSVDPVIIRNKASRLSELEQNALKAIDAYEKNDLTGFLVLPWPVYDFGPLAKISVPDELREELTKLDRTAESELPV